MSLAGVLADNNGDEEPTLIFDTSEKVNISALALLKMLIHAKAEVPEKVIGLMLGHFIDEHTILVVDVIAMPRNVTGVSGLLHEFSYHEEMIKMLKRTGSPEMMVVGWYQSKPNFGGRLSRDTKSTQLSFQDLHRRAIVVVIDPIQSVKGKVVIQALRMFNKPREITSNLGNLSKPNYRAKDAFRMFNYPTETTSILGFLSKQTHKVKDALRMFDYLRETPSIPGFLSKQTHKTKELEEEMKKLAEKIWNQFQYSIAIHHRMNELEEKMLMSLHEKQWTNWLELQRFDIHARSNEQAVEEMRDLVIKYNKALQEEDALPSEKVALANVGRQDVKRRLEELVSKSMTSNLVQMVGMLQNKVVF